jgi:hypothetical protein
MTTDAHSLSQAGDALERAWRADLRRQSRRRVFGIPRRAAIVVALTMVAVGAGAAVASGLLKSSADEQKGMLAANTLFTGSSPHCVAAGSDAFHCTLSTPPTGETFYKSDGQQAFDLFKGIKAATTDSAGRFDGGCVATTSDGLVWDCYLGQAAVANGIISPELLGQISPGPAAG